jgi:hypothetical protein
MDRDMLSVRATLSTVAPAGRLSAMANAISARRVSPLLLRPAKTHSPAPLLSESTTPLVPGHEMQRPSSS